MTSVTSSQVILNGPKDWDNWLEIIRTTAIGADIWSLINPNIGTPVVLIQPQWPEPSDVHPPDAGDALTAYSTLSADEKEQLRTLQARFSQLSKKYDRKLQALGDVRKEILKSIKRDYISHTHHCDSVHDILVTLKDAIAPSDKIRVRELTDDYLSVCKPPTAQNVDIWIRKWEKTHHDCVLYKIPHVAGSQSLFDFV